MGSFLKDGFHLLVSMGANLLGPGEKAFLRLAFVSPVFGRHMLAQGAVPIAGKRTRMGSDAAMLKKDLHKLLAYFDLYFPAHEPVRHRVVMLRDFDVIVQVDARPFPGGQDKWIARQGLQCWLVGALKQSLSRQPIAFHYPLVQAAYARLNRRIQLGEAGELLMTQRCEHLLFDRLYGFLNLRFVFWRSHPRR